MLALLAHDAPSEHADAWKLGIPDRAYSVARTTSRPEKWTQDAAGTPPRFDPIRYEGGWKIAVERTLDTGGRFRGARGPRLSHPRTRVTRPVIAAGPGVHGGNVMHMPANLRPSGPWWEDHLFGAEGYMSQ